MGRIGSEKIGIEKVWNRKAKGKQSGEQRCGVTGSNGEDQPSGDQSRHRHAPSRRWIDRMSVGKELYRNGEVENRLV